jgi:hypothetical protein
VGRLQLHRAHQEAAVAGHRTRGDRDHAWRAGQPADGLSHERRVLFVSAHHYFRAAVGQRIVDLEDLAAWYAEDMADVVRCQTFDDALRTGLSVATDGSFLVGLRAWQGSDAAVVAPADRRRIR